MTEIPVFDLEGRVGKEITLPTVFNVAIRPDIIKRVVIALQSHRFQPKGRDVLAGKRTTAISLGAGYGLARIPRVKGRGYPRALSGAFAPGTVGGRGAHPPVPWRKIWKKINKQERRLAVKSAIAASGKKELVLARGHHAENVPCIPLVVVDELQKLKKAQEVKKVFVNLGLWPDIERAKKGIKVRAGKGKMRGRRLKKRKGPLIVIKKDEGIKKAASNFPGVDIVEVRSLNAELLAPGTHFGRLVVWTESAFKELDNLFRR
jgi:large subunit ribosomal protein L4e